MKSKEKVKKDVWEIREIDAWIGDWDEENQPYWVWNTSYYMGEMKTNANDVRKAFTHYLKKHHGITFKKNRTRIVYTGDYYEILDRKTEEPIFAAIYKEEG